MTLESPRVTLAIDPGENTGVAWGFEGKLVACYLAHPGDELVIPYELRNCGGVGLGCKYADVRAVVEYPKFYGMRAYKSPKVAYGVANSLIRESVTLGRWVERASHHTDDIVEVLPRDWKGTMPKQAMLRSIVARMSRDERKLVVALGLPKSLVHNVLDAIGIMLWSVGRTERVV